MKKIRIKTQRLELEAHEVPPWLAVVAIVATVVVIGGLVATGLWVV